MALQLSSLRVSLLVAAALHLGACGGNVATTSNEGGAGGEPGAGGGGSEAGGAGGEGGQASTGGSAGGETTSSSTATETGTATTGTATGPGDCPLLSVLKLSDAKVVDADGDGVWSAGESATAWVTMTNPTDTDVQYPGVVWSSDEPLVSSPNPYNAFFVLFAQTSMAIDVGFQAAADTPKGTKATLTVQLMDIQGNTCAELPSASVNVVIE